MWTERLVVVVAALGLLGTAVAAGCGDSLTSADGSGGDGGATSTTTSTSSSTSTASTTTGPQPASFVGMACTSHGDCGNETGARCSLSSDDEPEFTAFFGEHEVVGGPAGGYCTRDCSTDGDCPSDAVCAGGICLLRCIFGEPELTSLFDPPPADKCHARDDLMCVLTQGGNALCMPVCGSDTECPGERRCDLRNRVCTDAGHQGLPLGRPCVPDDDETPEDEDGCAGFCRTLLDEDQEPTSHMCSANCSLGGDSDETLNCGGVQNGLCALPASYDSGSSQAGDYAFCAGACVQHDVCSYEEGIFCLDVGLLGEVGKGYCLPTPACPNGDTCAADEACLDTAYGPVCIQVDGNGDPIIPLGEAVGSGGAGGAGGAGGN